MRKGDTLYPLLPRHVTDLAVKTLGGEFSRIRSPSTLGKRCIAEVIVAEKTSACRSSGCVIISDKGAFNEPRPSWWTLLSDQQHPLTSFPLSSKGGHPSRHIGHRVSCSPDKGRDPNNTDSQVA